MRPSSPVRSRRDRRFTGTAGTDLRRDTSRRSSWRAGNRGGGVRFCARMVSVRIAQMLLGAMAVVLQLAAGGSAALAAAAPASGEAAVTQPIGFQPLSDAEAAAHVERRPWEPRPQNEPYAHPPTQAQLAHYRAEAGTRDVCGLSDTYVDGNFSGTTDETMQWAAWKWGLDEKVVRAQMQSETNWDQVDGIEHPGDGGRSFGIAQVKVTVHDGFDTRADTGAGPPYTGGSASSSMSLNIDYYGSVVRAAMNGCEPWLAWFDTPQHPYPPTSTSDALWGAVGRWYCGCWWSALSDGYRASVQRHLADRDWIDTSGFYGTAGPWPGYG